VLFVAVKNQQPVTCKWLDITEMFIVLDTACSQWTQYKHNKRLFIGRSINRHRL
jgi:hypothetical protein